MTCKGSALMIDQFEGCERRETPKSHKAFKLRHPRASIWRDLMVNQRRNCHVVSSFPPCRSTRVLSRRPHIPSNVLNASNMLSNIISDLSLGSDRILGSFSKILNSMAFVSQLFSLSSTPQILSSPSSSSSSNPPYNLPQVLPQALPRGPSSSPSGSTRCSSHFASTACGLHICLLHVA
ncbi:hypothetical protein B0H11DRAFT_1401079 [Mycena galericulata]|nr:hypothetical protein B0H11DRAFT_1401079 [Mycena galericulata]